MSYLATFKNWIHVPVRIRIHNYILSRPNIYQYHSTLFGSNLSINYQISYAQTQTQTDRQTEGDDPSTMNGCNGFADVINEYFQLARHNFALESDTVLFPSPSNIIKLNDVPTDDSATSTCYRITGCKTLVTGSNTRAGSPSVVY